MIITLYTELKNNLKREPTQDEYNSFLHYYISGKYTPDEIEDCAYDYVADNFCDCINCNRKVSILDCVVNEDGEKFCCGECRYEWEHPDDSWKDEPRTAEIRRGIV